MPYIPRHILEASVFHYPTARDAEHGEDFGASGFLLGVQSSTLDAFVHLYVVTNAHVTDRCPVSRIVKEDGSVQVLEDTQQTSWIKHPDGDDVAIRPLGAVHDSQYWYVDTRALLSPDDIGPRAVGPGDDCLMIGRYVNFRERQFDQSVVRFGNLAMLPEPVRQESGFDQESFLVDMRSVPGYSGSHVYVYYEEQGWRTGDPGDLDTARERGHHVSGILSQCWVLGIDWGHLGDGMAAVVPAWKLKSFLDMEELVEARERTDQELADQHAKAGKLDVAVSDIATNEDGSEFERFEDLTRKLVQTPKPPRD